jgi:hypothetical protein
LALEERMQQRECEIAALETELSRQSRLQESTSELLLGRVARLEAAVSPLIAAPAPALVHSTVPTDKSPPPSIVPSPSVARAAPPPPMASSPSGSVPQAVVPIAPPPAPASLASAGLPPPSGWNSAIVADFPKLFEDFKEKQFTLLWRGSRDGFCVRDFHRRCDGHRNTLTVILDTDGNIFGGFTPVQWDSRRYTDDYEYEREADPSLTSFIFTLKNPYNIPARKFVLKAARKHEAISCSADSGPCFYDFGVSDKCNANTNSWTYLGNSYTNDAGLDGRTFFTGSKYFRAKEIEVFEITD